MMLRLGLFLYKHRLTRFFTVGAAGFLIEASILTGLSTYCETGAFSGRLVSFPAAVLVTWTLNRKFTFKSTNSPGQESLRYFLAQCLGALCNLFLFFILIYNFDGLARVPIVPLFFSALLGLVVNFTLSKYWVFQVNG